MKRTHKTITTILLAGVLGPVATARGDLVAAGNVFLNLVISTTNPALLPVGSYTSQPREVGPQPSRIQWDDAVQTPFGVPVNFGQIVGSSWLDGSTWPSTAVEGAFSQAEVGVSAATYSETSTGAYVCADSSCNATTFLGTFATHSGTAFAGLPPDTVYTFDGATAASGWYIGTSRVISGVTVGYNLKNYTGRVTINAFRPAATAASTPGCEATDSCAVEVTRPVEFTLPDGTSGSAEVAITYPAVLTAGTTTVSAMSDSPGDLPADVAIDLGGYRAAFFELQTTAVYDTSSGPIEVCLTYDLTGTPFQPSELTFLHRENGVFVDRTSRLDEANNQICGALMSFSPVVLAISVECQTDTDCDDSNPCSADSCLVGKCESVVDPQCVRCSTPDDCVDSNPCTHDDCTGGVCQNALPTGCYEAGKATLKYKNADDPTKNNLTWKFAGGGVHFGKPAATTGYTFCILDQSDNVLASAEAPAGAPYWTTKTGAASYKDSDLVQGGISTIKLHAKYSDVTSKITLKGKGPRLELPAIPTSVPLRAVLSSADKSVSVDCWQTTLSGTKKNEDGKFSAKK